MTNAVTSLLVGFLFCSVLSALPSYAVPRSMGTGRSARRSQRAVGERRCTFCMVSR